MYHYVTKDFGVKREVLTEDPCLRSLAAEEEELRSAISGAGYLCTSFLFEFLLHHRRGTSPILFNGRWLLTLSPSLIPTFI